MNTKEYKVIELNQCEIKQIHGGSDLLRRIARSLGRIWGHILDSNESESQHGVNTRDYNN